MRFIDLFAGIGGFRYGLESVGYIQPANEKRQNNRNFKAEFHKRKSGRIFTCVYSNEWDKYAAEIYQKNFGEAPDTRDIRTVPSEEIPDHDLLCAGFPCQSFSVAGKRKGFEDTRGTLFFEIARIARDKRPRYLLLENVKGLLSHQEGKTFQTILGVLSDLGYRCEWQVLNSKHFGVPQNRERVFIVGHLGEESTEQIFPIEQRLEISLEKDERTPSRNEIATSLTKNYHKAPLNKGETYVIERQAGELRLQKEPCVTRHYGTGGGNVPLVMLRDNTGGNIKQRIHRIDEAPSWCLGGSETQIIEDMRIRRLTPIECERLQGFPDNWTEGVSDTQRYKMLGNAVTVNVVQAIGERILEKK